MKRVRYSFAILMTLMLFCLPLLVKADDPDPGDDPDAPLDGGVSLLIAASVGYGAKKIHEARKKNREEEKEE